MSEGPQKIITETPISPRVNSENFIDYLLVGEMVERGFARGDIEDFEKQIDIGEKISGVIRQMYESSKEGLSIGVTRRKQVNKLAKITNEAFPGQGDQLLGQSSKVGTLEQARIIYMDTKTRELRATSPRYGHKEEVCIYDSLKEATQNNGIPLILIHTHPDDQLFSFYDYLPFIIGEPSKGLRLIRAGIVLCPDIQIMAVATNKTPFFRREEDAVDFASGRMGDFGEKETEVMRNFMARLREMMDRENVFEVVLRLREKLGSRWEKFRADVDPEVDNITEEDLEMLKAERVEVVRKMTGKLNRLLNSALVSFGREVNVKLYFSQDMRNFKEFGA